MWNKYNAGGSVPQMSDGRIPRYDADGSGPIYGHVEGGNVQTSPNSGVDNVSVLLRPGEYVLRSESVDALGGVAEVDKLNALGGPNNPQKYANQRPQSPMPPSPLSGRMPLTEITKRDRHGASVTMKFDPRAEGGSYQDANGLWGILNDMQQEATSPQKPPAVPQKLPAVPQPNPNVPTFFGGGWLSSLFSPDEERQAELAATADRIAAADKAQSEIPQIEETTIPFGDEAVLQTSSQANEIIKKDNVAKSNETGEMVPQFTGEFDESNKPIMTDVKYDEIPFDPAYDRPIEPYNPAVDINTALDNAGQASYEEPTTYTTPEDEYGGPIPEPDAAQGNPLGDQFAGYADYSPEEFVEEAEEFNTNEIVDSYKDKADKKRAQDERRSIDLNKKNSILDDAAINLAKVTGDNSEFKTETPEDKANHKSKVEEVINAGNQIGGTTGNPEEDAWFKKEFSGVFGNLFGTGSIAAAMTRGLVLYAGARLTGMTGNQALAFAGQDALDEGTRQNEARAEAIKSARKSKVEREKWARNNMENFTSGSLKGYVKTGNYEALVGLVTPAKFDGFGEMLQIEGIGAVRPIKASGGKGEYVNHPVRGLVSVQSLIDDNVDVQPFNKAHTSENVLKELAAFADEVRTSKDIDEVGANITDTKLGAQINEVVQEALINNPSISTTDLMASARYAIEDAWDYQKKFPNKGNVDAGIFMKSRLITTEFPQIAAEVSGSDPAVLDDVNKSINARAYYASQVEGAKSEEELKKAFWDNSLKAWNAISKTKRGKKIVNNSVYNTFAGRGEAIQVTPYLAFTNELFSGDQYAVGLFNDWSIEEDKKKKSKK